MATIESSSANANVVYAGFWWRVLASILDYLILIPVVVLIIVVFGLAAHLPTPIPGQPVPKPSVGIGLIPNIIAMVLYWIYFAGLESSKWRATVGKRICGLVVTDMNGGRLSFGRATGRYFAKIVSSLTLMIGYIMVAFTARKQGLHDMIADTLVMRRMN